MGPRTTVAAIVALTVYVGCIGYSLGRDAARLADRSTLTRPSYLVFLQP